MLSIPQRYRRTDRQTDGRTTYDSNTALALRASRGKNDAKYNGCTCTRGAAYSKKKKDKKNLQIKSFNF